MFYSLEAEFAPVVAGGGPQGLGYNAGIVWQYWLSASGGANMNTWPDLDVERVTDWLGLSRSAVPELCQTLGVSLGDLGRFVRAEQELAGQLAVLDTATGQDREKAWAQGLCPAGISLGPGVGPAGWVSLEHPMERALAERENIDPYRHEWPVEPFFEQPVFQALPFPQVPMLQPPQQITNYVTYQIDGVADVAATLRAAEENARRLLDGCDCGED